MIQTIYQCILVASTSGIGFGRAEIETADTVKLIWIVWIMEYVQNVSNIVAVHSILLVEMIIVIGISRKGGK